VTRLLPYLFCVMAGLLAACTHTTRQSEVGGGDTSQPNAPADSRTRARIHTELASLYFQRGQDAVAVQELKDALVANPDYAPAYSMLGLVYMDLKENALAQANFERALKLIPNDSDVNNNYGWFLCQTGSPKESIPYFINAVKNPLYATPQKAYLNAGLCAIRMEDRVKAEEYLQHSLEVDPNLPQALLTLAQLRYRRGRYEDAKFYVERFNKVTDPTAESLWLALRVERKLGDRGAEATIATQLRRSFSGSREYQDFLKGIYE
jgi:type IV pilus assembly protein PilF